MDSATSDGRLRGAGSSHVAQSFRQTLLDVGVIGINLQSGTKLGCSRLALGVGEECLAARRVLEHQLGLRHFASRKEMWIPRNQARRFVEFGEGFFKVLVFFQFQSAGVSIVGFFQIVLGRHAVDAARHAVAAGDGRRVERNVVGGKHRNAGERKQNANRRMDGAQRIRLILPCRASSRR